MQLPPYQLHSPASIDEAVALAQQYHGDCDFLAGGTDLLPNYKERLNPRRHLIALTGLEPLTAIGPARIGAAARLVDVARSEAIRTHYPSLVETIGLIASPLLRESGTVGGNLMVDTRCHFFNQTEFWREARGNCFKTGEDVCHVIPSESRCFAAYSGDLAPLLIALGCRFGLVGPDGAREVAAEDFFVNDGIKRHVLAPGEFLTEVIFTPEARTLQARYRKLRLRDSVDFPLAGVAVALRLDADGQVQRLRVVINAVASAPIAMDGLTDPLIGTVLTGEAIDRLAAATFATVKPLKTSIVSTDYRKKMVRLYLRQILQELTVAG